MKEKERERKRGRQAQSEVRTSFSILSRASVNEPSPPFVRELEAFQKRVAVQPVTRRDAERTFSGRNTMYPPGAFPEVDPAQNHVPETKGEIPEKK